MILTPFFFLPFSSPISFVSLTTSTNLLPYTLLIMKNDTKANRTAFGDKVFFYSFYRRKYPWAWTLLLFSFSILIFTYPLIFSSFGSYVKHIIYSKAIFMLLPIRDDPVFCCGVI